MSRAAPPLQVPTIQRRALEDIARSRARPTQEIRRAKALLLAADGVSNVEIARRCAATPRTVAGWRARFRQAGMQALRWDRRGRVAPAEMPADLVRALAAAPIAVGGLYLNPDQRVAAATARRSPTGGRATVVGAPVGESPADGALVELASQQDLLLAHSTSSGHRDLQTFLKAVVHRTEPDERILLVLDRWSSQMDHYEIDRWLAHPRRERLEIQVVASPLIWLRLVTHWLRPARGCAAVAPRVQR